jgi:hypothetical protein
MADIVVFRGVGFEIVEAPYHPNRGSLTLQWTREMSRRHCADFKDRGQKPTLLAVHSIIFKLPLLRELALALGCIDVGRESILAALAHGHRVAVLPGGVREVAGMPEPEGPSGLVRLAHEYAIPLVPVHFGGEADLCWVWAGEPAWLRALREWLIRKTRAPFPLFFVPRVWRRPQLKTVIGEALISKETTLESFNQVFQQRTL